MALVTPGWSLRAKWTAALLCTGALPLFLFAFATVSIQRRGLETAERQLEVAVLDHTADAVVAALAEAGEGTHRVGQLLTDARVGSAEVRLALAGEALQRTAVLSQVAIYGPDGRYLDALARPATVAEAPRPPPSLTAAEPAAGGGWQQRSGASLVEGAAVLRYLEPVDAQGSRRAFVLGTVVAAALSPRLLAISRDRFEGRADGVLLLGEDLEVLAGGGTGPLAAGASLAGRDLLAGQKLAGETLARPFALSAEFVSADGEPMVGSLRTLPSLHAAVVVRRSRQAAYGALAASRRLLLGASAAFLVLAVVLGAWLAARTTRPVAALVQLTRAYGRRQFTTASPVRTGDELQLLGSALEEMAGGLLASDRELLRQAAVRADLSRYLPGEVARAIAEGRASLALGGERRAISVLFADVVSFTPFAEAAPPERAVALLNELFTTLTEVVFRHGGTVDKFIGDSVMALFGAPQPTADHAARALLCAEDMHRFVEAQAPAWRKAFGVEVRLGIGVNSGEALVGNLGSQARMEYTAIGDVVNVAARLEALARAGQTLLSRAVAEGAGPAFRFASLGEQALRGRQQALEVLELSP